MIELQAFDRVLATYNPPQGMALKSGMEQWLGWRGVWVAMWLIEDGPYAGQWALTPDLTDFSVADRPLNGKWCPESAVIIHEVLA